MGGMIFPAFLRRKIKTITSGNCPVEVYAPALDRFTQGQKIHPIAKN